LRIKPVAIAVLLIGLAASLGGCDKCGNYWGQPQSCGRQ
jgi:hypothetical protein